MATAATSLLGLALPVTGELSGTWGDTVNVSITALLDTAVAGTTTLSADSDVTLTTTTLAANQARQAIILWTAGGTVTRTITVPAQSKSYIVINKTSSSQSIKIVGVGPTTGVTIVAGTAAFVVWNGVDFVTASVTSTTGILPVANGGTGLSSGTSGGVLAYTASGTLASSAALAASALVIGGGAGAAPSTTTTGTGVVTALGVNTGTAGSFVVNGGALGSPSTAGTIPAFTLGGTVSGGGNQINNVIIGTSTPLAGAFTTLTTSSTVTHNGGTANGVAFLDGSKVLTTGSALTFDGTNFLLASGGRIRNIPTTTTANALFQSSNDGGGFYTGIEDSTGSLFTGEAYAGLIWHTGNRPIAFGVNNTERMRLTSSSLYTASGINVAFGTTSTSAARLTAIGTPTLGAFSASIPNDPNASATATITIGANTDGGLYGGGGYGLKIFDKTSNSGSGQTGYGVYISAPYDGTNASGNTYALTKYGVYVDDIYSYYGINSGSGNTNWGLYIKGGANNYIAGNLGVGTTSPTYPLTVQANSSTQGIRLIGRASDNIANMSFVANNGSTEYAFINTGATYLALGVNSAERARIDSSGNLLVGTTSSNARLTLLSTSFSATNAYIENNAANCTGANIYSVLTGSGNNNTTAALFTGYNITNGDVFKVYGNGNVVNANNSYGAISDVKLKENISDTTPKLADLMQVKVRNYNLKTDPTQKQLGVIAQELEQVFPGMVDETPDRDKEGNDLGTTTKSVKYSVFVPMLIKAIQEQQALITQLTARITALETP